MKLNSKQKMVNFVAQYSIYVITVVFMIICTFLTDKFLTASNLVNILRQVTVYAVLAFGQAILLISGNLDLCAGSGCLGLAIASQVKDARVVLGELSDGALRVCRQNIRRCGLTGRVTAMQLDALRPPLQRLGDFDCIVSNPPYIPSGDIPGLDASVRDYEPHMALDGGADGLDFYRAICAHWRSVLHPGSRLCFEVGIGQADDVLYQEI